MYTLYIIYIIGITYIYIYIPDVQVNHVLFIFVCAKSTSFSELKKR